MAGGPDGGGGGRAFDLEEGMRNTDRYGLDQRAAKKFKLSAKEKAYYQALETCQPDPPFPIGDGFTAWIWSWFELIVRGFDLATLVIFMLYLFDNYSPTTTFLRWFAGAVAVVWGVWWVFCAIGGATQYMYAMQMDTNKNYEASMRCNVPPMRYGFMYLSFFTTGFFLIFGYLHQQILDDGADLISEGNRRAFNAKIWMFSGLLLLDLIYTFCDYFVVVHSLIDAHRGKKACQDLHDRNEHEEHDNMPLAEFAVDVLDKVNTLLAYSAILFLGQELSTGGNTTPGGSARDWAPSTWMYYNGSVAIIMGSVGLIMAICGIILRNHRCIGKSLFHGFLYWMGFAAWHFAVWYRMFVFIHDNARDGLTTEIDRRDWERLLWVSLIAYAAEILLIYFHNFRCLVRYACKKVGMLKHCYSL